MLALEEHAFFMLILISNDVTDLDSKAYASTLHEIELVFVSLYDQFPF